MSVHPLKSCACAAALLFSAALLGSNSAQAANVGGIEISDCVPGAKNCKAGNTSQTTGPLTGSSSGKPSGGNTGSMGQNGRPCPAIWARRGLCTPRGSASSNAGPWNQGGDRPCRGRRCADGYGGSANAGPWDSGGRPCRGRRCANQDGYGGVYLPTGGRPGGYL
jgi:hypothetical protein